MPTAPANLFVCAFDHAAVIQIKGRATFSLSPHFKALVSGLRDRGTEKFVLDLTECSTMDSTFLGVLTGLALELGAGTDQHSQLELCCTNARVMELLENLGIAHLFKTVAHAPTVPNLFKQPTPSPESASKQVISQTCLDAHKTLMDVNPNNIPKFKDVAQFLAEDLKKSKS